MKLTFEQWAEPPYGEWTEAWELANGQLHKEQRDATEKQEREIWNQEGPWKYTYKTLYEKFE